ncbi:acpS [Wigglesworthia glossinidia endosymbiont of Glossina brevipalpis]|uniref:Holo-[acyl-carrier-protein] synthase n=1 Tax=Wigglesworthia glossinidia brevipalpis TaxID=36870 RepID=ACPS_WIGBR|nr:RecName: Full=Holo-[acyl-carrier-protein] synthase; Short=Holo-ACP synthase; AltName: Full=4'-phosphopantetheinyl transferase AcpS [Wigglesworthia glossinidia endosymbiont of Glossina brevipalpis]BAC24344.1 acpS [Wigglesworthia glossinidia endosymbiont of Glossina brevipalpis]
MAIIGIGIDIVNLERINKIILCYGNKFVKKILSFNEKKKYYELKNKKKNISVNFLAKRLAAKEAASKAFGLGMKKGLYFSQFEVLNNNLGKPYFKFNNTAKNLIKALNITNIHLSLTDERKYACATVIFEDNRTNIILS